jgi:hypothetical protein
MSSTGPTGPTGPSFPVQPYQFPQVLQQSVSEIKRLTGIYQSTTDPNVKASYKVVITDRVSALQEQSTSYAVTLASAVSALVPA